MSRSFRIRFLATRTYAGGSDPATSPETMVTPDEGNALSPSSGGSLPLIVCAAPFGGQAAQPRVTGHSTPLPGASRSSSLPQGAHLVAHPARGLVLRSKRHGRPHPEEISHARHERAVPEPGCCGDRGTGTDA